MTLHNCRNIPPNVHAFTGFVRVYSTDDVVVVVIFGSINGNHSLTWERPTLRREADTSSLAKEKKKFF